MRPLCTKAVWLAGVGIVVGLACTLATSQLLRGLLFGVSPVDPVTFVVIGATLAGVALLASYLPARRAASADPAASLRR